MAKQRKKPEILGTDSKGREFDIGLRIKELRMSRSLSQVEFAKLAKISQSTVALLESGRKDPSLSTLNKITKALDVALASLFVTDNVHVFDLVRLRRKYTTVDQLTPNLYTALGKVIQFAKDVSFLRSL